MYQGITLPASATRQQLSDILESTKHENLKYREEKTSLDAKDKLEILLQLENDITELRTKYYKLLSVEWTLSNYICYTTNILFLYKIILATLKNQGSNVSTRGYYFRYVRLRFPQVRGANRRR